MTGCHFVYSNLFYYLFCGIVHEKLFKFVFLMHTRVVDRNFYPVATEFVASGVQSRLLVLSQFLNVL